jgi:spore maturation protein CgeB
MLGLNNERMKVLIFGLSITSSWGNGHTVTFRALTKALRKRGHEVIFFERDVPWYRSFRDEIPPEHGRWELYSSLAELSRIEDDLKDADCVIIGSFVPEGVPLSNQILRHARNACKIFYDLDTPITLRKLESGDNEYISPVSLRQFDLYLSFAGGAVLDKLAKRFAAQNPVTFWCCVDPELHQPKQLEQQWDLGYLGTYSGDRQPQLHNLLLRPARSLPDQHFVVSGPLYPPEIPWPDNVQRIEHTNPAEHGSFYARQRFTLNITRAAMARNGYSPSTRLFEAAACATPVISDPWTGLDEFFHPGSEILVAADHRGVVELLRDLPADDRQRIGERARQRVLNNHTAEHRVIKLENLVQKIGSVRLGPTD